MNYFLDAFKQYATFTGRATRTQYWMFVLFYVIFYVVLSIIDNAMGTMILALIFSLALLIPSISIAARRLHDTGRSGWWQLIVLLPVIGIIVLIVFLVLESQGDNEYGAAPQAS
jgi:uncharacterized membrane protein YhaH (DUF805 family)